MRKHKTPYHPAEHRALIPARDNVKSGYAEGRPVVPQGFLKQLKLALKRWELEEEYPHLRKARSF